MTIKPPSSKTIKDCMFLAAKAHCEKKAGPNEMNHTQIMAVTNRALDELKKNSRTDRKAITAKLMQGECLEITALFEKIIVSGKSPWAPQIWGLTPHQNTLYQILRSTLPINAALKDRTFIEAALIKTNDTLLNEARGVIPILLKDMFAQIEITPLTEAENFHMEMIVGELLSLYPFLAPKDGEKIAVPQRVDGFWTLVEYTVAEIRLTPKWMGSPLVAYGLSANNAPPLLLFKGTTYATDKGASLSILTDLNPGDSVGGYAFQAGKKQIHAWLQAHTTPDNKAIVYGKSLGGAQSWRTAIYFPDRVKKVLVYGAPGFAPHDLKRLNCVLTANNAPEFHFFCQKNDPVPYSDFAAKKGVNYYQVIGSINRKGVMAHADMYATHVQSAIIKLDPAKEARRVRRVAVTVARGILSFIAFIPLLIAHIIQTVAKAAFRAIKRSIAKCRAAKHRSLKPQLA